MYAFSCPHCRKSLTLPANLANGRVRCPGCGQVIEVPEAAPPPPRQPRWFYARDKRKVGPLSWSELRQAARVQQLSPGDMVLQEGTGRWLPARDIPDLFPLEAPAATVRAGDPKTVTPGRTAPSHSVATTAITEKAVRVSRAAKNYAQRWWPIILRQAQESWRRFRSWPRSWQYSSGGACAALVLLLFVWVSWPGNAPLEPKPESLRANVVPPAKDIAEPDPKKEVPPEQTKPRPLSAAAASFLQQLNDLRRLAKLAPVDYAAAWSKGCQAHAEYLVRQPDLPKINPFEEDPGQPGFSEAGRLAARVCLVLPGEPKQALDHALARFFPRVALFDPQLGAVGVGMARQPDGNWLTVLDVKRGRTPAVILFPADEQDNVPLHFSGGPELPGPINQQNAGFPISVTFAPERKITQVRAALKKTAADIPCDLSTPEKSPHLGRQPNSVCLIAKSPLLPSTRYDVEVSALVDNEPWTRTWHFTTGDDQDATGAWADKAMARVNEFRKHAGLEPVVLDADLTQGCKNHARYLQLNADHPLTQGLGAHEEDASLPGFTEEGKRAAKGNIALGEYEPLHAIDEWMATLYHRVPILNPQLRRIGFSCARGQRQGWIGVLDVHGGKDKDMQTSPLIYPAQGQTGVPLFFPPGGEIPDPIPMDKDRKAGYPVTITFPPGKVPQNTTGTLYDDKGVEVAAWFSSPEKPANPRYARHQGATLCLIAHDPLRPTTTYRVQLHGELDGAAWRQAWTFTTVAKGPESAEIAEEVIARINHYRSLASLAPVTFDTATSQGCLAHAEYLVRNASARGSEKFNPNDEDARLPGFSAAGQEASRRADVFFNAPVSVVQIDMMMAGFYRRAYLLDPDLRRVGFGCAAEVGGGWTTALDLNTGRERPPLVLYPMPSQEKVSCAGLDRYPGKNEPAGFPISVTLPQAMRVEDAQAVLTDPAGQTLETYLSAPDRPLDKARQGNSICVLPRLPFRPESIYQVTVSARVNGQLWRQTWRFSTAP